MKRVIKKTLFLLVGIIMLVVILSTISYSNYWAKDSVFEVSEKNLELFHESYEDCRLSFQNNTQDISKKYNKVEEGIIRVDSEIDTNLTIDWCYIPAQVYSEKLFIVNSGLHGIEGYTGSAIQLMFLNQILPELNIDSMGVLFIHGINPYGFKYRRKVTENNIDLNRNCVVDETMYLSKNEGYEKLRSLLMPDGKVNLFNLRNKFFHLLAIKKIVKESMPVLRQAALQGQYEFNGGIYYGGEAYEPQIQKLKPILISKMESYEIVLNVDLHTAYGKRGKMHLFLNPVEDKQVRKAIHTIFKEEEIDWGSGEDFYTINGEYLGWVNSLSDKVLCIPMLFEFGTLDSQKTFGSLKSIQVMINENQGHHYGYKNNKSELKAKSLFDEMYYPSSKVWRSKVIDDAYTKMSEMMINFEKL